MYAIKVDEKYLNSFTNETECSDRIETLEPDLISNDIQQSRRLDAESLTARQHTLIWTETNILALAPGAKSVPLNITFDQYAEELSFPSIYYGIPRQFSRNIKVTTYMKATSEIRRKDRRGAIPNKILYVVMKILRQRVVDGIRQYFKSQVYSENITRRMLDDPKFLEECLENNFSFLKSLPNSVQYWSERKNELFAMIRQLGKPTMFLTISANEIRWPHLLELLKKFSNIFSDIDVDQLTREMRCDLVSDDPVIFAIYFNKLTQVIMKIISAKTNNPFGKFRVIDHFLRIEFQNRGSPHAHILLWMENDPKEEVKEEMPKTIELIDFLSSTSFSDVPNDNIYGNNIHRHTFTCYKYKEGVCRFVFFSTRFLRTKRVLQK